MKNAIKNWLGITKIENVIGKEKEVEKKTGADYLTSIYTSFLYPFIENTTLFGKYESLKDRHEGLKKDFEELDNKIDHLERYLQIEFFKTDTETQVYDWSEKKKEEGYRKTKSYKEIKKSKEGCGYISDCDNDE